MPKKLGDMRSTRWSLTVWMPPYTKESANEMIQRAVMSNRNWQVEGQVEKGEESGKLHYQLLLKTPQVRGTQIQKFFPSVHIEEARNPQALENYVHKEETRVEEFKTVENRFISWREVRDKFYEWVVEYGEAHVEHDHERLRLWDQFIGESWLNGIECDIVGVNPQYRSCILKFWKYGVLRQTNRQTNISVDRQTDR